MGSSWAKRDYITLEVIHHNAYEPAAALQKNETPARFYFSYSLPKARAKARWFTLPTYYARRRRSKLMLARGNTNFKMIVVSDRARLSKVRCITTFSDRRPLLQAIFDRNNYCDVQRYCAAHHW